MHRFGLRALFGIFAVAATLSFVAVEADARPKSSFGSRGDRTFSAPPSTATAPNAARPMERSVAQPGAAVNRPAAAPAAAGGGFFNRPGLLGGLAAGFLGAGLLGMLMGNGFAGGLGGIASIIGLMLQVGLVLIVARLAWAWWQRRNAPATAMASGPSYREAQPQGGRSPMGGMMGGFGGGLGGGLGGMMGGGAAAAQSQSLETTPEDFDAFEKLLGDVQTAYGKQDIATLRSRVTPEVLSYFNEDFSEHASRGLTNRISNVALLQGDLAEAWREGNSEYASVAMRYSLTDEMLDANGNVVEGGPEEATEVWTFMRATGGKWILSAIQQT